MRLPQRKCLVSSGLRLPALAGALVLAASPAALADTATFSVDLAAMTAHRYVADVEVNHVEFFYWDTGVTLLDISDDLFGTAAWPDPSPQIDEGPVETGIVTVDVVDNADFFDALAAGNLGLKGTFTDTDDAMFAIDFLSLTGDTIDDWYYGWPESGPNDGYGLGLADGGDLPGPLPDSLPPGSRGTGFDETISSKSFEVPIPEPVSVLFLGLGALVVLRRRVRQFAGPLVLLTACTLATAPATAQTIVPAGTDIWSTPEGFAGYDFYETPLPADFFGPGSDPFDGAIEFEGLPPLVTDPPGALGNANTVVERRSDTTDLDLGPSTVDIEIVALSLVSTEPITVTQNGGQDPELWHVEVCLSDTIPTLGTMTITKTHPDGGTFDSDFPVIPLFTFTRVSDSATVELNCGASDLCDDLVLQGEDNAWTILGGPKLVRRSDFGAPEFVAVAVDADCDGDPHGPDDLVTTGSSINFLAGVDSSDSAGRMPKCWVNEEAERERFSAYSNGQHDSFLAGFNDADENGIADECEPDQLHTAGPIPNRVVAGPRSTGTIDGMLERNFNGLTGWDVVFTKVSHPSLSGTYTFTSGTVSPDGTQATVTTDANGAVQMTFSADGVGPGLIEVTVAGTGLSVFSFFEIVAAPPLAGDGDCDGDVDLADVALLQRCITGGGRMADGCAGCDVDGDQQVELDDFTELEAAMTGPL
ncbi:MAG TPA: hypothetical protein VM243_07925 [Phycisphaerae bacterium]|nr:hypothetical protein [Phycisphaerae bacterium]